MKYLFTLCFLSLFLNAQINKTIYDFEVTDIQGHSFSLSTFKGKKILIVNTASKCGFTYQYEGLEELYKTYKNKNFVVVGFPSNDFGNQEPGTNNEIVTFCKENYGVTFPMMDKVHVKGNKKIPLYKFLSEKSENGVIDSPVQWNFHKFLIDEKGHVVNSLSSKTEPNSEEIVNWIISKN